MNFSGSWKQFRDPALDVQVLAYLEISSDALGRFSPEPVANVDELSIILEDVRELQSSIEEGNLEPDIQEFLLRHLRALEDAIVDYRYRGIGGLRAAVSAAVGEVVIEPDKRGRMTQNEMAARVWRVFSRIAQIVAFTVDVLQLTGASTTVVEIISSEVEVPQADPAVEPNDTRRA